VAVTAQVEQLIPVCAVACQAGGIVREQGADLFAVDQGDQLLEAGTASGGASGASEVGVDDADALGAPAQSVGAVHEVVLEIKTLQIGNGLMWAGLADIDDRQAIEMSRGDTVGDAHR
jgi:hypothetical protein